MASGRKQTPAELLVDIFADNNSAVYPDLELDESEFELDSLDQRWRTYGTRAQSGTQDNFAWHVQ